MVERMMIRSFGARPDRAVSDEPFHSVFLKQSRQIRPVVAETIAEMDSDWESVLRTQSDLAPT